MGAPAFPIVPTHYKATLTNAVGYRQGLGGGYGFTARRYGATGVVLRRGVRPVALPLSDGVQSCTITAAGADYTAATATCAAPPAAPVGTPAGVTATLEVDVAAGAVTAVRVVNPGSGYVAGTIPAIVIAGDGAAATADAVLQSPGWQTARPFPRAVA